MQSQVQPAQPWLSGHGKGRGVVSPVFPCPVPARYFKVSTTSTELAAAAVPYRYDRLGAFRLFERAEGEIGGNATIILTYRAFYDSTLTYAYRAVVVNQLTALP